MKKLFSHIIIMMTLLFFSTTAVSQEYYSKESIGEGEIIEEAVIQREIIEEDVIIDADEIDNTKREVNFEAVYEDEDKKLEVYRFYLDSDPNSSVPKKKFEEEPIAAPPKGVKSSAKGAEAPPDCPECTPPPGGDVPDVPFDSKLLFILFIGAAFIITLYSESPLHIKQLKALKF